MKKVKYMGDMEVVIFPLHVAVKKDDIIEVPDDFENGAFVEVQEEKKQSTKEATE